MKIAFLSFYSGMVYRGVETFVHELANRLSAMGHAVTVYQNGPKIEGAMYKTISVNISIDWSKKSDYTPFFNYYGLMVKKFTEKALKQVDTSTDILFPTNGQWTSLLCSLWTKTHKAKLVLVGQSGPGMDDRINLWTFPKVFIALTDHQKKWAKRINPFVRVEKIPNGVNLKKFSKNTKPYNLKLLKPIILSVAALDSLKRNDLTIKAVSKTGVSLVLVGKGSEENNLKLMGDKLLPDRFKILSFRHSEMPKIYVSADIFAYATVPWESFGIAILEAMASGLPVVVNDDPIRREIVGNAGLFVDPTDTEAYVKTLEKALEIDWEDKPRKQAEKFDWDKVAKQYEQLFMELI